MHDKDPFHKYSHIYINTRNVLLSAQMGERASVVLICITRNVLLSAQMGERASVVLICIITSGYNEVK